MAMKNYTGANEVLKAISRSPSTAFSNQLESSLTDLIREATPDLANVIKAGYIALPNQFWLAVDHDFDKTHPFPSRVASPNSFEEMATKKVAHDRTNCDYSVSMI
jgi:hypothetical protein